MYIYIIMVITINIKYEVVHTQDKFPRLKLQTVVTIFCAKVHHTSRCSALKLQRCTC